ncbi:hypothetical protein L1065_13465 [Nereida sp. MMG024]|nr:hypothetical protein [Nereida sp. MMG025]
MLSTSLTPYSLVTLKTTPDAEETETAAESGPVDESAAPEASQAVVDNTTIWELGNAEVTTNGQTFDINQLPSLAEAIGTQADPGRVVIVIGDAARVQDVTSALEALESADVAAVQIAQGSAQ